MAPSSVRAGSGTYSMSVNANNIATTAETVSTTNQPTVYLSATNVTGHPCTLWDQQDVNNYIAMLGTNAAFQSAYNSMLADVNKLISLSSTSSGTCTYTIYGGAAAIASSTSNPPIPAPVSYTTHGVPIPQTQSGTNCYLGDATDVSGDNGGVITQMGIMYVLTGSQQYGAYARQMLVEYANYYNQYGHPPGWTKNSYRSALDGRLSYQFLNDAFFLCNIAFGYDLIRNLPTLTGSDQTNIRTNLLEAICEEFTDPVLGTPDYLSSGNNRSCISAAGTLMAGYAADDSTLINEALYGTGGSASNPKGGLTVVHMGSNILPDGLWIESSIGYQIGIASCGVFDGAIMMEHHGMNAFQQYPIKRLLDSAIYMAYPNGNMLLANLGNTGPSAMISNLNYASTETGFPYWYGYLYYQDQKYLPIMRDQDQTLMMTAHNGAPGLYQTAPTSPWTITQTAMNTAIPTSGSSIFTWLQSHAYFAETYGSEGDPLPLTGTMTSAITAQYPTQSGTIINMLQTALSQEPPSSLSNANFFANGYGIFRTQTLTGPDQLLVEYGSGLKSHSQPAELSIDLYAMNGQLMSLPGDIFPYNDPLDSAWYWTTLANNTVTVDGSSQVYAGNYYTFPAGDGHPYASQVIYGTGLTMGIQKISSTGTNSVYAYVPGGVTQDRAVFMSPNYTADLFGNFSGSTHTYDLAWHPIGTMTTSLNLTTGTDTYFASGTIPGYESMTNVQHAFPTGTWSAQITMQSGSIATLFAAANPSMEVITGKGHLITYTSSGTDILPPVILERSSGTANVVYGNVIDTSGASSGYVTNVTQEGGLSSGYALLKVQTVTSGTDLCFTSYSSGTYTTSGSALTTNAQQAFVTMNGANVLSMYLGGGTQLTASGGSIQRIDSGTAGTPGLADIEYTSTGYVIGNMSQTNATINVTLPGIGSGTAAVPANSTIPSFSVSNPSIINVMSGTTGCVFAVTLSETNSQTVTVNYATANGSAVSGSNYIAQSGSLTFAPGTMAQTITVPIVGDPNAGDPSRTFTVNLSGATNSMLIGNQGVGMGMILPTLISGSLNVTAANGGSFVYWITGSNNPMTCSVTGLPPGLTLNTSTGLISGVPTGTGTFYCPISATDSQGTSTATLVIIVPPASTSITSSLTATGTAGSLFNYGITATNSPFAFHASDLPTGLSVNTSTGILSGTPAAPGTYYPTIFATNSGGTGAAALTLTILPQRPAITSATSGTVSVNYPFDYAITATNNPTSYSAAGLPFGLNVDSTTGLVTGIPTQSGTFSVTLGASNAGGSGSGTFTLTVQNTFYSIAAGNEHSVAVKDDGTVWTWGNNADGQLGNGTTNSGSIPVQISGISNVIAVGAGTGHTLALKNDGTVWAWGYNAYGQLGSGTANSLVPIQVPGLSNITVIAAGANHNFAMSSSGTVWAWGQGNYGQLGTGTSANVTTPVQIIINNVKQIFGGEYHSIALKNDGTVWTWGANGSGQLGNNTTSGTNRPAQVSGLPSIAYVGLGYTHSAAVTTSGSVYMWGGNSNGQLGNSGTANSLVPVLISGVSGVTQITGGYSHTTAIASGSTVWSWGSDGSGQLGNSNTVDSWVPVQSGTGIFTSMVQVAAGNGFSLFLKSDGSIWGAGGNFYQTLGNGTGRAASTPVQALNIDLIGVDTYIASPIITGTLAVTGMAGSAFSYNITATNSPTGYLASGLPGGLAVSTSTGLISGTPAASGTFTCDLLASNAGGVGTGTLSLTIQPAPPVITGSNTITVTDGIAFAPYTYDITATNDPTSYYATGLPPGLSIDNATGMILGTPSSTGTYQATISAVNISGTTSSTLTFDVNQPAGVPALPFWALILLPLALATVAARHLPKRSPDK